MSAGALFVFEGPDGVGKTSISTGVVASLTLQGIDAVYASFPGREHPGTLGSLVYSLHHEQAQTDPTALQVAHISAHIDAIKRRILPSLAAGQIVVLDRFWWSTLAYANALGCEMPIVEAAIAAELIAWGDVEPARIYLVERASATKSQEAARQFIALQAAYSDLANQHTGLATRFLNELPIQECVAKLVAEMLQICSLPQDSEFES